MATYEESIHSPAAQRLSTLAIAAALAAFAGIAGAQTAAPTGGHRRQTQRCRHAAWGTRLWGASVRDGRVVLSGSGQCALGPLDRGQRRRPGERVARAFRRRRPSLAARPRPSSSRHRRRRRSQSRRSSGYSHRPRSSRRSRLGTCCSSSTRPSFKPKASRSSTRSPARSRVRMSTRSSPGPRRSHRLRGLQPEACEARAGR